MAQTLLIRPAERTDAALWERMRAELWPDESGSHSQDITRYFSGNLTNPLEVLVACAGSGEPVGFIELSIRPYAEGCTSERVAFVEGWFVDANHRGRGVGSALVAAAEEWGRTRQCTELASDTQTFNETSIAAHTALGFEEVERLVCFRKSL
jgi:aminoglycoside 6'-N-acetyltransferase I